MECSVNESTSENVPSGWGDLGGHIDSRPTPKMWGSASNPQAAQLPPASGWGDTDLAYEENMEEIGEEEERSKYEESSSSFYAAQISPADYQKQTSAYTKTALRELLQSPEYKRRHTTCRLCWSVWSEGVTSPFCVECGGFAMKRPCPVCEGRCGGVWTREVDMSHDHNEAHWDGDCLLPEGERLAHMARILREPATEENLLEGMEELSAS